MQELDVKNFTLTDLLEKVVEWELEPYIAYSKMKQFEKQLKTTMKKIESYTIEEIQRDEIEMKAKWFYITNRETLNYKEDPEIQKLEKQIKARKELIKTACKVSNSWWSCVDDDWVIVEPVSSFYKEILTYKQPK